jgi:phosphoadenosine phosphosulfate reductase
MVPNPRLPDGDAEALAEAASLDALYGHLPAREIIARSVRDRFPGKIAAVSSFGADSAALLHMIAEIDRDLPIIFLETGKHFEETLQYRDALVADFGLSDVRAVKPEDAALERFDPQGILHQSDTDACCRIRKVEPMARAVLPFDAWITGRKRFQASTRNSMPVFESVGTRIRINPLARWTTSDQADYMRKHALRANPLVAYGYLSIGCFPCTQPVQDGDDARSGRWAGHAKVECGIHLSGLDHSLTDASL